MPLPRALRSGAFRFALVMVLVFGAGSAVLLAVVHRTIAAYTADAAEDSVSTESAILLGEERERGRPELAQAIARHERATPEHQLRYLLVDRRGSRLAGALPSRLGATGWHSATIGECTVGDRCPIPLLTKGVRLSDGAILVVASDTSDLADLRGRLLGNTIGFGAVISALALAGGLIAGGAFVRRLEGVNAAIDRIVAGRFAERLPRIGMGAEFDELSSRLNAMLDRIEQLVDGLRQVSVDIAHDLRTPLTRVRQRLERLEETLAAEPAAEVQKAIEALDGMLDIFAALLRIGALESGAARASFATVDLSHLARRIAEAYQPEIEDGGRSLTTSIVDAIRVEGDQELLGQALANLIENAMTHTASGTAIMVELRAAEGEALIAVVDDGPGVAVAERERVLRRFYRLDRSRTTPGAGLGLSLVASVASLHGGSVTLADADPGLRITLRLPALRRLTSKSNDNDAKRD